MSAETLRAELDAERAEVRRLRDVLKEIAQLGLFYGRTPWATSLARKALGVENVIECKALPVEAVGQVHRLVRAADEALSSDRAAKTQGVANVDVGVPVIQISFASRMRLGHDDKYGLDHALCPPAGVKGIWGAPIVAR